jgi:hypothetical protein
MTEASSLVLYTALVMAVAIGLTAWRLASAQGRVSTQVDGMLGACLVTSGVLFVSAVLPGSQLP